MVHSDRAVSTSYRLSIVLTISLSAAVWPQFSMERLSYNWPYLGNGER